MDSAISGSAECTTTRTSPARSLSRTSTADRSSALSRTAMSRAGPLAGAPGGAAAGPRRTGYASAREADGPALSVCGARCGSAGPVSWTSMRCAGAAGEATGGSARGAESSSGCSLRWAGGSDSSVPGFVSFFACVTTLPVPFAAGGADAGVSRPGSEADPAAGIRAAGDGPDSGTAGADGCSALRAISRAPKAICSGEGLGRGPSDSGVGACTAGSASAPDSWAPFVRGAALVRGAGLLARKALEPGATAVAATGAGWSWPFCGWSVASGGGPGAEESDGGAGEDGVEKSDGPGERAIGCAALAWLALSLVEPLSDGVALAVVCPGSCLPGAAARIIGRGSACATGRAGLSMATAVPGRAAGAGTKGRLEPADVCWSAPHNNALAGAGPKRAAGLDDPGSIPVKSWLEVPATFSWRSFSMPEKSAAGASAESVGPSWPAASNRQASGVFSGISAVAACVRSCATPLEANGG